VRANGKQYIQVLSHINSPIRVGFTATLPTDKESLLTIEGLLGPVIGEFSRKDAIEKEIIAMPKVRLIKLPYNHDIKEKKTYFDVYQKGIVENNTRNRLIIQTAKQYISEGLTVIILINRIEHGEELKRLCDVVFKINAKFIYGSTKQDEREEVKRDFINGDIDCVIASTAWGEGINIPTVNVMINGAGGKDELRVLQHIGRVLRKTENKDSALVIDFFDPSHHYLINHFGERITLYMNEGWL
jgi:superfamily II DNA or RNA helicase